MSARRKSLSDVTQHSQTQALAKTLSWPHLIALGVGAIVGTGIYTLTGVGAECFQRLFAQHFNQILGQRTDRFGLVGIRRVGAEQVPVFFDKGATAAGGLHNRFGALFNAWPPGVDVASGPVKARRLRVKVVIHGTATTGFAAWSDADPESIQHSCGRRVSVG